MVCMSACMCGSERARKQETNFTMEWLRLVGSLTLEVSSAEYRLFHSAVLQKRPII